MFPLCPVHASFMLLKPQILPIAGEIYDKENVNKEKMRPMEKSLRDTLDPVEGPLGTGGILVLYDYSSIML